MYVEETLAIEANCIKNLERLGLSHYEAVRAYDDDVDWHEVERLKALGCTTTLAVKITAGF